MGRAPIRLAAAFGAALALAGLGGCAKQLQAPVARQVCWHLVSLPSNKVRFNPLAEGVPNLETCAADLEKMRLRFTELGMDEPSVTGAYQGQFLFIQPDGVFTSSTFSGFRYLLMVRTGDGRLAVPGAMPLPSQPPAGQEQK
ncbi:MAG: hypothetical protein ACRED8_10085 [Caulobacteraceae bacterium]